MSLLKTLKDQHRNHPFSTEVSLSNPSFLKFNGSFNIKHLDCDLNPFILVLCKTQEELDRIIIENKNDGIFIHVKPYNYKSNQKNKNNIWEKIKDFFGGQNNHYNFENFEPIIIVGNPKIPYLKLIGSGSFKAEKVKQDNLHLDLFGSGSIKVSGQVTNLKCDLFGSGEINCKNLHSLNLTAQSDGSGNIIANAHHTANATLTGSGEIKILGEPAQQSFRSTGSGKIRAKPTKEY